MSLPQTQTSVKLNRVFFPADFPKAVHLGACCGYGYGRARKLHLSPSDFQGPNRAHRTPQETGALREQAVPIPDVVDDSMGTRTSYKEKDNSSPGSSVDVSEFGLRYRTGPEE
ncbi:hypothetical protein JTE90_017002 [Oedothorax gibbosus]|uniref:Uncharacterized protein n=1 Tax=Oedothorax gibbosus TaxID=931172 RepID=A0AAV6THN5_9ARAC|nr:hypothetical protein JTE90_017002 [Oedothorax gibbosus]